MICECKYDFLGCTLSNLWENLYQTTGDKAMMKFPFPIVIELLNFFEKKYPESKPENINILEIGCGSGANIKYAASLGYNVYGIDISQTAVDYCIKSFDSTGLYGNIQVASVDNMPFKDTFFHIVIDHGVLVCVNEEIYKKAIDEVHRVLVGGGIALLTPQGEICTKNIRLFKDDYSASKSFKGESIYINNIGLYGVINILDNRFKIVFLRRNDRITYEISDDNSYIKSEKNQSMYHMFIEKL